MRKELKEIIDKDLSRVYTKKLSLIEKLSLPLEIKYLIQYRKAAYYTQTNPSLIKGKLARHKLLKMSERTQIQISAFVKADAGLYIGHLGRIIIHPDVTLGKNVNLATGITLGQANRGKLKGVPTIGNNVWIGTNAVVVGNINIGNDVLIAPNAYVNMDVPDHSIVIGNPATIHSSEYATKDYINRTVE